MKSLAVMKDRTLKIVDVKVPEINEYQALVKIRACGVCNGTDIKLVHQEFKDFDTYPAILGHEGAGEIVQIGSKVKSYMIGDMVLLPFADAEEDGYYSGWGAYSEYGVVGDAQALIDDGMQNSELFQEGYYAQTVVPENIDPVDATMIITFREVLAAIKRFNITEGKNVVIFGGGPVGLTFAKLLKARNNNVILFEVSDKKVERALEFGVDYAFNSKKTDIIDKVWSIYKQGADFVIDAVGNSSIINAGMELIKDHGKISCYGISPNLNMDLDWSKAPYNWDLQFVQWPSKFEEAQAHEEVMNYINSGVLVTKDFITDVIEFDNIYKAFEMIENRETDLKTVIKM